MNKNTINHYIVLLARIALGVILIYASLDKLHDPYTFAESIEVYDVLGPTLSRWVAIWLPLLELVTGVFLIFGIWIDAASIACFLMMAVFMFAVGQAYARGLDIDCGCFSSDGETKITAMKLFQNFGLLLTSIYLVMQKNALHRLKPAQ